ncbi:hypothetical protein DFQ12_1984 [Sphingobacterium detergens]|uniref:Uncharacterized protein n=1 Tax=Sphingobacterium detergens TaxID=1145106 RepID=A0A420BK55_SPHD1|nr:hypothetical protein DFQ12_1984 [Sphingobacterium detergens]
MLCTALTAVNAVHNLTKNRSQSIAADVIINCGITILIYCVAVHKHLLISIRAFTSSFFIYGPPPTFEHYVRVFRRQSASI